MIVRLVRQLYFRFGLVTGGEATGAVLGFIAMALAARGLGPKAFGVFGFAAAAAATASVLTDVRFDEVIVREWFHEPASPSKRLIPTLLRWDAVSSVVTALFSAAVLAGLVRLTPQSYLHFSTAVTLLAAAALRMPEGPTAGLLSATRQTGRLAVMRAVNPAARLLLIWTVQPDEPDVLARIWLLSAVVSGGTAVILTWEHWTGPRDHIGPRRVGVLRDVGALSVASSIRGGTANLDQLLVGIILSPENLGIYRVAKGIASLPGVAMGAVRTLMEPDVLGASPWDAGRAIRTPLRRLTVAGLVVGTTATALWLAAGPYIITAVYGNAYYPAANIALILLVAASVEYTTAWSKTLPLAIKKPKLAVFEGLFYAVATVAFMPVLAWTLGVTGAAVAALLIALLASSIWLVIASKATQATQSGSP